MSQPEDGVTGRVLDTNGASWPDTGRRCTVCGWPTLLDEAAHLLCELDPSPAPVEAVDGATSSRLCADCRRPLPAAAGIGITCHLACWQDRRAADRVHTHATETFKRGRTA